MKKEIENILGSFEFDIDNNSITKKGKRNSKDDYSSFESLTLEQKRKVLEFVKKKENFSLFYEENIKETKKDIKNAFDEDILIIQCIRAIEDYDKIINILISRLREWYEYFLPEISRKIENNSRFLELISDATKENIMNNFGLGKNDSMGGDFDDIHYNSVINFAKQINNILDFKSVQIDYLESLMKSNCPNLLKLTNVTLGAQLIEHAGSIKRLSKMSASTIQLLGAEKALFRHIITGAKCPKYGVLINHPIVNARKANQKGKAARVIADKISIAVKVDYFKGDYIADKLFLQIENKLKND
jgi:nucleolar protein 56